MEVGRDGIDVLIHAEIVISCLKREKDSSVPKWFLEDLTYLLHLCDVCHVESEKSRSFQARVYWLHCHWHYHHCRVEAALNFLQKVQLSIYSLCSFYLFSNLFQLVISRLSSVCHGAHLRPMMNTLVFASTLKASKRIAAL